MLKMEINWSAGGEALVARLGIRKRESGSDSDRMTWVTIIHFWHNFSTKMSTFCAVGALEAAVRSCVLRLATRFLLLRRVLLQLLKTTPHFAKGLHPPRPNDETEKNDQLSM